MSGLGVPFRFSTADFVPAKRLDRWHATLESIGFFTSFCGYGSAFDADFCLRPAGSLVMGEFHTAPAKVLRTAREIAQCSNDGFLIYQQRGAAGSLFRNRAIGEVMLSAGDIVVTTPNEAFANCNENPFHHFVAVVPRSAMDFASHRLGPLDGGVHLRAGMPMTRLLSAFLAEAYDAAGEFPAQAFAGVAEAAAGLLASVAGMADEELAAGGLLALVQRRIRQRLRDPLLTPARIAAECGISLRRLHGLFVGSGDTFGSFVRRRRLALAHAALDDARNRQSISDLAIGLGFNSLATFYRVYHAAYGEAPGETRAAAAA